MSAMNGTDSAIADFIRHIIDLALRLDTGAIKRRMRP